MDVLAVSTWDDVSFAPFCAANRGVVLLMVNEWCRCLGRRELFRSFLDSIRYEGEVPDPAAHRRPARLRSPIAACQTSIEKRILNWKNTHKTFPQEAGAFVIPDRRRITAPAIRVVVVTCLMAAKVAAAGLLPGHFTHIIIDEVRSFIIGVHH